MLRLTELKLELVSKLPVLSQGHWIGGPGHHTVDHPVADGRIVRPPEDEGEVGDSPLRTDTPSTHEDGGARVQADVAVHLVHGEETRDWWPSF